MDPLSYVLSSLRPSAYGFRGLDAGGDWSLSYEADGGVRCFAIEYGSCNLHFDDRRATIRLRAGDFILVPGNIGFRLASHLNVISRDAAEFMTRFPPGTFATIDDGGDCAGIGGYFAFEAIHSKLVARLIPSVVHVAQSRGKSEFQSLIERAMGELREPRPGGALLSQHLIQSLLIEALRSHLAQNPQHDTGWLFALADPGLSRALAALHADPGAKWSLDSLSKAAAMSRSGFAKKFRTTVGITPMQYLAEWRMILVADRFVYQRHSLARIATDLGYQSDSALSFAFKRVMGQSPREFLNAQLGA